MKKIIFFKGSVISPDVHLSNKFSEKDFLSRKSAIKYVECLFTDFFKAYPTFSHGKGFIHDSLKTYIHQVVAVGTKGNLKLLTFQVKEITLSLFE